MPQKSGTHCHWITSQNKIAHGGGAVTQWRRTWLTLLNEQYMALLQDAESQPVANVPVGTDEPSVLIRTFESHTVPPCWRPTGHSLRQLYHNRHLTRIISVTRYVVSFLHQVTSLFSQHHNASCATSRHCRGAEDSQQVVMTWKVMQSNAWTDIASWHTKPLNNYTKSQRHASMTITLKKKKCVGEVSTIFSQIVLKYLYLARTGIFYGP